MLELVIHKTADSKEIPVFLTLPASRWDVLEAKARLGVDNLNGGFYEYEPPSDVPQLGRVLKTIWRGQNFFEELNHFSRRLTEMSSSDRTLLNGAIAIHGPEDMKTLINLTHHELDSIVMAEVSTDTELGRLLVDNDFVEFPEEVIPYLDFAKIGAEHRANTSCAFDGHLYYEDLSPEITEVYDGRTLPEQPENVSVFKVTISGYCPEPSIDLLLPATEYEVGDTMDKLNILYQSDLCVMNAESRIALLNQIVRPDEQCAENLSFRDLNELAYNIRAMDDNQYIKFLAILEEAQIFTTEDIRVDYSPLDEVLECSMNLDVYDLTPGIRPEDVGSYGLLQWTPVREQEMAQTPQEPEMAMGGM